MRKKMVLFGFPLLAGLLAFTAAGAPAAERELARCLPDSTLVYVGFPDLVATAEEYRKTAVYQVFQDEEVQQFVEPLLGEEGFLRESMGSLSVPLELDTVMDLSLRGLALAITDVDVTANDLSSVGLVIDIQPSKSDVSWDKILEWLREICAKNVEEGIEYEHTFKLGEYSVDRLETGEGALYVTELADDRTLITTRTELLESVLHHLDGGDSGGSVLAEHASYRASLNRVGRKGDEMHLYVGMPHVLETALRGIETGSAEEADRTRRVFEVIGLAGIENLMSALSYHDLLIETQTTVSHPGEQRGFWDVFSQSTIPVSELAHVPAKALSAHAFALDWDVLWELIFEIAGAVGETERELMEEEIRRLEDELDLQIQPDLIAPLSGDVLFYQNRPVGFGSLASFVALVGVEDAARFEPAFVRFVEMLVAPEEVRRIPAGDVTIYAIAPPALIVPVAMQPCFAIADGYLLFALQLGDMRSALKQMGKKEDSLLTAKKFGPARKSLGLPDEVLSVSYYDVEQIVLQFYGAVASLSSMAAGAIEDPPVDFAKLPTPQAISQYFGASMGFATIDDKGVTLRSSSPIGPELYVLPVASTFVFGFGSPLMQPVPPPVVVEPVPEKEDDEVY